MGRTDCQNARLSSRTVGILIIISSILLFGFGLLLLPVVGFIFAIPLLLLGVGMIASPDSKTCQLIMSGLRSE